MDDTPVVSNERLYERYHVPIIDQYHTSDSILAANNTPPLADPTTETASAFCEDPIDQQWSSEQSDNSSNHNNG